ncbi:sigma factor [Streptomyces sp. NPDC004031]
MADPPDDPRLWERRIQQRLARGEAAALGELYDRHARLVHGLAVRLLGEEKAAQEVVVEVFRDVWEDPAQFEPQRERLPKWLAARTYQRAAARAARDSRPADDADRAAGPAGTTPAGLFAAAAVARSLPEPVRSALQQALVRDVNYRQLAAELGISGEEALRRLRAGLQVVAARTGAAGKGGR